MDKVIVTTPQGNRMYFEPGPGGGYFDESLVLWDERTQGPAPDDLLAAVALEMQQVLEANKAKEDAVKLLSSTDWMVIRQMDSGVAMPEDIKQQRAAARLVLNPKGNQ